MSQEIKWLEITKQTTREEIDKETDRKRLIFRYLLRILLKS